MIRTTIRRRAAGDPLAITIDAPVSAMARVPLRPPLPGLGPRYAALMGVLLAMIFGLGFYAWHLETAGWETTVVRGLQTAGVPGLREISIALAVAGSGPIWFAITVSLIALLWDIGGRRPALLLAACAAFQLISTPLKVLTERTRPAAPVEVWHQISSYSFPSGHVLSATLVVGFLCIALGHCALPRPLVRLLRAGGVLYILLMGLGRMIVGAHWPTDVIGGYLIGALLLVPIAALLRQTPPPAKSRRTNPTTPWCTESEAARPRPIRSDSRRTWFLRGRRVPADLFVRQTLQRPAGDRAHNRPHQQTADDEHRRPHRRWAAVRHQRRADEGHGQAEQPAEHVRRHPPARPRDMPAQYQPLSHADRAEQRRRQHHPCPDHHRRR